MSITVAALIGLRNRVLDDFIDGRTSEEAHRADLGAIAVELDRLLSPDSQAPLEERTARVLAAILVESRARCAAVTPAKAARLEFWHRNRLERLRREDPQATRPPSMKRKHSMRRSPMRSGWRGPSVQR